MSLKTRLDSRSDSNNSFKILDKDGEVLAEISMLSQTKINLQITTKDGLYIEKPNGWRSKSENRSENKGS